MYTTLVLVGCTTQSNLTNNPEYYLNEVNCPEGGNCSFEVLKDKSLTIKKDEFSKLYPSIENGENLVIQYQYQAIVDKDIQDGAHREVLLLEIDPKQSHVFLKEQQLENVKMIYGRLCNCRGSEGYFQVNQGELYLINENKKIDVNLKFEIPNIKQRIHTIKESIKY